MLAKLFTIQGFQVLARKTDDSNQQPAICVEVECGIGIASSLYSFVNSPEGEKARDEALENEIDEEVCAKIAEDFWRQVGKPGAAIPGAALAVSDKLAN